MKIAVRMDDVTPDMNWERFYAFKTLLDQYGLCPLIGIVPDNQDENLHCCEENPDFWTYIKELQEQGWVIAMHGFQHTYTTKRGGMFPLNHFSEFAGISYEKQCEMLCRGKKLLAQRGIDTELFMAPAHSYDRNTLKALRANGFTCMTDGFGKKPYRYKGLTFYPISFMLEHSLRKQKGCTTMVVHANTISDRDLARYECLFAEHKASLVSYGELFQEKPVERGVIGHAVEYLLAAAKHVLVRIKG